jgi:hypothetical protein
VTAFIDILNELGEVSGEAKRLQQAALVYTPERFAKLDEATAWLTMLGLASAIDKIYTGCERAMMLIAKHIDGEPVGTGEAWHVSLLLRMKNLYPDIWPAVLSQATLDLLNKLRSFRHRQRHAYSEQLDCALVLALV